jgi:hypothetical protein
MGASQKLDELVQHMHVQHGRHKNVDVNLCAVVRDEMYLLPAFFDHYRRLGVQQFIILDDGSNDGSCEYLAAQSDCVLLSSGIHFGDQVEVINPDGTVVCGRADPFLKCSIARNFCSDKYAVLVDADEFLVLPPQVSGLCEAFSVLAAHGVPAVAANMVEVYPRALTDLKGQANPRSFSDLIALYPFFDATPLLELVPAQQPTTISATVTQRIFESVVKNDHVPLSPLERLKRSLRPTKKAHEKKPKKLIKAHKVPIVKWSKEVWLKGNHATNLLPSPAALLALIHFKFTHDFTARATRAVHWKSHAGQARKYRSYLDSLAHMRRDGFTFLCAQTRTYAGPEQLLGCGLLKWDF